MPDIVDALRSRLPDVRIETSPEALQLNATDVFYEAEHPPIAILHPTSTEAVQAIVRAARALKLSVAPRGAGLSYSKGYIPADARTVVIDLRSFNQIREINLTDRYVVVDPGVTWEQLYEALRETGLRTRFWGTFSGKYATVGGALSQGAKFFGSGNNGTSAEAVLGLKVVLGDGEVLVTGSAATPHRPSPFFRTYGPDITGLFLGDTGAFGIKTEAVLQLVTTPEAIDTASFTFNDAESMLTAMSLIGADLLASECFGFDPFLVELRMKLEGLSEDLKTLKDLFAANKSKVGGLKDLAALMFKGRRYLAGVGFMLNVVTEGVTQGEATAKLEKARAIALKHKGVEIANSLPKVLRASPFRKLNRLLGPEGERIVWFHAVVPNSRTLECFTGIETVFADHAEAIEKHGIRWGYLLSANGPSMTGIEPIIYWRDEALPMHAAYIDPDHLKTLPRHAENLEARQVVTTMMHEIIDGWVKMGAGHLQIGRKYPYMSSRNEKNQLLLKQFKATFDPDGIFNPGVLEE